ncbi:MAG: hypothetical protein WCV90_06610 [Candidatus Woesearchaeota archaeon]|jgi:YHS domain-containing protein
MVKTTLIVDKNKSMKLGGETYYYCTKGEKMAGQYLPASWLKQQGLI